MAITVQGGTARGGLSRRRHSGPAMAEINIVPLVDVVLVLLIIFMVTAQVMEFGLEVNVPKVKTTRDSAEELPVISLTKTGEYRLNDKEVNINEMGASIRKLFPNQKGVYVRADKDTTWDALAQVVAALGQEKFDVRLVTQPSDGK
jgi:biopolymer transport protein ExbD